MDTRPLLALLYDVALARVCEVESAIQVSRSHPDDQEAASELRKLQVVMAREKSRQQRLHFALFHTPH
jgi:hypothetical protein